MAGKRCRKRHGGAAGRGPAWLRRLTGGQENGGSNPPVPTIIRTLARPSQPKRERYGAMLPARNSAYHTSGADRRPGSYRVDAMSVQLRRMSLSHASPRWGVALAMRPPGGASRGRNLASAATAPWVTCLRSACGCGIAARGRESGLSSLWNRPCQTIRHGCLVHAVPAT
jgi:hypothetical protein